MTDLEQAAHHTESPFNKLPEEIHSEIISLATHGHEDDTLRFRFPSILIQLSRHWNIVTNTTPKAWSFILITNSATLAHVPIRLAKTGGVALDIYILDDEEDPLIPSNVMGALGSAGPRWATLHISTPGEIGSYTAHFPKTLRRLRSIYLKDDGTRFSIELSLPQLKYMHLDTTWLGWHPSTSFSNLTKFRVERSIGTNMPIRKLLGFLRSAMNLQVLILREAWLFERPGEAELLALQSLPITFPRLTKMVLDGLYCWEIVSLLTCIQMPALRILLLNVVRRDASREVLPSPFSVDQLRLPYQCVRQLILKDLDMDTGDLEHIVALMPEVRELSIDNLSSPMMKTVFGVILEDAVGAAQRIATISFKDTRLSALRDLYLSLSPTSQLVMQQVALNLNFRSRFPSRAKLSGERDISLEELQELLPHAKRIE